MTIYVFGNELIPGDSLTHIILPKLKRTFSQVNFVTVDPNENFPPKGEKNLVLLDTVKGISGVTLLDYSDLAQVTESPISPHDYDLLLHLLLLKKMGKLKDVKIIGIPYGLQPEEATSAVSNLISTLL